MFYQLVKITVYNEDEIVTNYLRNVFFNVI